jgi:flagellar assembly protein FliH
MGVMAKKIIKSAQLEKKTPLATKVSASDAAPRTNIAQELGGVVNRRFLEAQDQAAVILNEAKAEAQHIRAEAKALLAEVDGVKAQARDEGRRAGEDEGRASVTQLVGELERLKEEFYNTAEPEVIKLVMQCAQKVIGTLVESHQETIQAIVQQAIAASIGDHITIRVSSEDYATITAHENDFRALLDRTKRLHIKEDDTITTGGCVVETEVGTIDAQLETQLEALRKAFAL